MNRLVFLDYEVFNAETIKTLGSWGHARTGLPLLVGVATDDQGGEAVVLDLTTDNGLTRLAWFAKWVHDNDALLVSHGAYDRLVAKHHGHFPSEPERWRCNMAKCFSMGLPGKLDQAGEFLGLGRKLEGGARLINRFCKPDARGDIRTREDDPENWAKFMEYCRLDVELLRRIWFALPDWNYPTLELDVWLRDQYMNDRGLPIDRDLVEAIYKTGEAIERRETKRFRHLVGLNPTQRDKVMAWFNYHGNLALKNMQAETLEAVDLGDCWDEDVFEAMEIRKRLNRATMKKYRSMLDVGRDGALHHQFQWGGAQRTLRWAGRDVQPQNLMRPLHGFDPVELAEDLKEHQDDVGHYLRLMECINECPPLDVLSSAIRGMIEAPEDHEFVGGDLSQIEARGVLWLAGAAEKLEPFYDPDRDPYVEQADAVGSDSRQLGKVLVLSCGFGTGGDKFQETAASQYGVEMTNEEAHKYVRKWRLDNAPVVDLWEKLGTAFTRMLRSGEPQKVPVGVPGHRQMLVFERCQFRGHKLITIRLPSGHRLLYWDPRFGREWVPPVIEKNDRGEDVEVQEGYWRDTTKIYDPRSKVKTIWGGFLTENVTQAFCRNIMAHAIRRLPMNFPLVGTVHDELVALVKRSYGTVAEERMAAALMTTPKWAGGLRIDAEMKRTRRYTK